MINILHYYCRPNKKDLLNDIAYQQGISFQVNDKYLDISDIVKELTNKNHIDCIAIDEDLFGQFDTASDIQSKIEVLRYLCENTEILIIALNKSVDDEVLQTLRNSKMAEFIVTKDMSSNFEEVLTQYFNRESSDISYEINEKRTDEDLMPNYEPLSYVDEQAEQTEAEKNYGNDTAADIEADAINEPTLIAASNIFPEEAPEQLEPKIQKTVDIDEERTITIGICGLQPHIGVTHHALSMAQSLSDVYGNVCYKEFNNHGAYRVLQGSSIASVKQGYIRIMGVDIYDKNTDIAEGQKQYQFCVLDFGYIRECKEGDFFKTDIPIIVAGAKDWEIDNFIGAYKTGTLDKGNVLINFFPHSEYENFKQAFQDLNMYFAEYAPEVFATGSNSELYNNIVIDNFTRMENK